MIGSWKRAAAVSALCLGLVAATAGATQERPPGPGGPQGHGQHGGPDREKIFDEMRMRREKTLHDILQIKPDQEAAFHTFVGSMTPQNTPGERNGGPREWGPGAMPMTTPERLDRMAARMADHQARFQKMAAATKTFYAALTPDQRRAFDAMPMMMGAGHHGRMGGGRHFEGPR